jgi:predicted DNA repair protein MutK
MAGSSLLALIDDIATILDDVAVMTKVAAKKTAGVLGDDLALNANQVSGVNPDRELPVVWAVAKGSMINKVILVPLALALSYIGVVTGQTWIIPVLLMIGGAFLCYEGFEKLAHKLFHKKEVEQEHRDLTEAFLDENVDMVQFEKDKIKGAIRTDFILSAEIIIISLGSAAAAAASFAQQASVLALISVVMTVGVYGLVAGIVKLDDAGLYLSQKSSSAAQAIGRLLLGFAPYLMKTLSIVGTAAMFMVGGHIIVSNIDVIHHFNDNLLSALPAGLVKSLVGSVVDGLWGVVFGAVVLAGVSIVSKVISPFRKKTA